jgi:hypothetical protein
MKYQVALDKSRIIGTVMAIMFISLNIFTFIIPMAKACLFNSDCAEREVCSWFNCVSCKDAGIICCGLSKCCKDTGACSCQGCAYYCYCCPDHCSREDCSKVDPSSSPWCESSCGASSECDKKNPNSYFPDVCLYNVLEVSRYCDSNCIYSSIKWYCNSDNCSVSRSCGGNTYTCVYEDDRWQWSTTIPTDFCCSDADCPAKDNKVGKCNLNTYRCEWPPCSSNADCVAGSCCVDDPNGPKPGTGVCVGKGKYSDKYLCDPPEWTSNEIKSKPKKQKIFESILKFLSQLFFQR